MTTPPFSRRTVVRVGAHTAWLAPAISIVTAAPALAASGPALVTTTAMISGTGMSRKITVVLSNANTGVVDTLSVSCNFNVVLGSIPNQDPAVTTPDWTAGAHSQDQINGTTFDFTESGTPALGGNATTTLAYTITNGLASGMLTGTLSVTPTITGSGTATGTSIPLA